MKNWQEYWINMPRFYQEKKMPFAKITAEINGEKIFIRFKNLEDFNLFLERGAKYNGKVFLFESRLELADIAEQKITDKTKSIWFPFKSHWGGITEKYKSNNPVKNKFPIYVVSKGRYKNNLTSKALHQMNIDHFIVVEKSELYDYVNNSNKSANIITLPQKYLDDYDCCDNLGDSKSKGPGAARNFCIDHSKKNGFQRHWVMDDNIDAFHYLTDNKKLEAETSSVFAATENFVCSFENVPVAGLNYYSFCKSEDCVPAFKINTRIYSCLLIDNFSGYRWRGRYNEDTDLSLRVLKDGKCTIQMNAFLCGKVTTQRMAGGNTKEFYSDEGTLPKSQMLADLHPDVARVVWRFGRWHHHVNYKPFEDNELKANSKPPVVDYDLINVKK